MLSEQQDVVTFQYVNWVLYNFVCFFTDYAIQLNSGFNSRVIPTLKQPDSRVVFLLWSTFLKKLIEIFYWFRSANFSSVSIEGV